MAKRTKNKVHYIVYDNNGNQQEFQSDSDATIIYHAKQMYAESEILTIERIETTVIYGKR